MLGGVPPINWVFTPGPAAAVIPARSAPIVKGKTKLRFMAANDE
jgi:hypothetical protein